MRVRRWTLPYLAPSLHWEFSLNILKLNEKSAKNISAFNWDDLSEISHFIDINAKTFYKIVFHFCQQLHLHRHQLHLDSLEQNYQIMAILTIEWKKFPWFPDFIFIYLTKRVEQQQGTGLKTIETVQFSNTISISW